MTLVIVYFTGRGESLANKLNTLLTEFDIRLCKCFGPDHPDLSGIVSEAFDSGCCLLFIGAVGIAVRSISPYVSDKLSDIPVVVADDAGEFIIPILSGHVGGANKLAVQIAGRLEAIPVITTSTDVNTAFSADLFAVENNLKIRNRDGIRRVNAKAIENKSITLSIKDYPPDNPVDIIVADSTDCPCDLLLSPKKYTLGIGLRKEKDAKETEEFVSKVLSDNGVAFDDVYALCTIDIKEDEPALKYLRDKYRIPLICFEASVLNRVAGSFDSSGFVKQITGTDNVCERAAVLCAGSCAELVVKKTKGDGVTVAVAQRGK